MRGQAPIVSTVLLVALALALATLLYYTVSDLLANQKVESQSFSPLHIQHVDYRAGVIRVFVYNPGPGPVDVNSAVLYLKGPRLYVLYGKDASSSCGPTIPERKVCVLAWVLSPEEGRYRVVLSGGESTAASYVEIRNVKPTLPQAFWPQPYRFSSLALLSPSSLDGSYNTSSLPPYENNALATAFASADMDGDGNQDLIIADWNALSGRTYVTIHYLTGPTDYDQVQAGETNAPIILLAVADVDGDGFYEVVATEVNIEGTEANLLIVDGNSVDRVLSYTLKGPFTVEDVDDDGVDEIMLMDGSSLVVWDSGKAYTYALPAPAYVPSFGDVDGDGRGEIVLVAEDGNLYLFEYGAGISLDKAINLSPAPGSVKGVLIYDFYVDGKPDLAFVGDNNVFYAFLNGLSDYNYIEVPGRPFTIPQPFQAGVDGNYELLVAHDTNVVVIAYDPNYGILTVADHNVGEAITTDPVVSLEENRTLFVGESGKTYILAWDPVAQSFGTTTVDTNASPFYTVVTKIFDNTYAVLAWAADGNYLIAILPSSGPG